MLRRPRTHVLINLTYCAAEEYDLCVLQLPLYWREEVDDAGDTRSWVEGSIASWIEAEGDGWFGNLWCLGEDTHCF